MLILVEAFFNQLFVAVYVDVEVFVELQYAFINQGLLFYGCA